tara:strand:+ start:1045 stop:1200 length:156 start_codon:yes stop_codon:yes gene_type:complete
MDKSKFPKNPYIGRIYFDGKKTYEYINNPFYGVIDGCKPQPSWVDITLELK